MSNHLNINYKDKMTHPECDRIIGKPTYETIQSLEYSIIANASCVPTALGGGAHRYLGLVKNPTQYALISPTAFIRPVHPGVLVIIPGTAPQMAQQSKTHQEALRLFNECDNIERTLKQQIVNAIDKVYLRAIINITTQSIQLHVHEIFEYLYRTYGNVTPQKLYAKESEVKSMVYNLQDPIDNIFNEIESLTDLAIRAAVPMSQAQCINIALIIMLNTRKFSHAIRTWNTIAVPTWVTFKTHFRDARAELETLNEISASDTQYNANIVQEVLDGFSNLLIERDGTEQDAGEQLPQPPFQMNNMNNPPVVDPSMLFLQNQLQQQQQTINNLLQNVGRNNQGRGNGGRNRRQGRANNRNGRGYRNGGRNQYYPNNPNPNQSRNANTPGYCWTHGLGNHCGFQCNNPAPGHMPQATLENKMGGSNNTYQPRNLQHLQGYNTPPNENYMQQQQQFQPQQMGNRPYQGQQTYPQYQNQQYQQGQQQYQQGQQQYQQRGQYQNQHYRN